MTESNHLPVSLNKQNSKGKENKADRWKAAYSVEEKAKGPGVVHAKLCGKLKERRGREKQAKHPPSQKMRDVQQARDRYMLLRLVIDEGAFASVANNCRMYVMPLPLWYRFEPSTPELAS